MVRGIEAFANLPTPVKIGLGVVSGGGFVGGLAYLLPAGTLWIILVGLAIVILLLVLYRHLLRVRKKRKAAPMERDLLQSTSATPQGVSAPANVARLDDLRKKFQNGVQSFHSADKSLYSLPWYMIVGEPGSGKTEAIRHCNVGFPPGLQDELQGTGGTINMNWWFTDHAVILDTAGRLMFEEVEAGGSKEWKEFLGLMKKYRPRCPINGLLLVIPADSLIKDTADQIEQKASKIARQLDTIQRTLDVRFPVFVVVTKSDLISGFRDFFDGLQDPRLQHQMLGWSNPAALDDPYETDFVDQHIDFLRGRLFRRRLALLHEILLEEPGADKTNTADTLYAFPQSLAKMAPRMTRYLELIFSVGSQWSCKPLFFRGIYFTSSMREGSALDADLAESLGVPVESLPEGRVWERDRAYFLRDLFVKKIFREKGLVTHATNASKLYKRRKAAVVISAAVSFVLLSFFTFYGYRQLKRSIGGIKDCFQDLAHVMAQDDSDAARNELETISVAGLYSYKYFGADPVKLGGLEEVTRANVSARLAEVVDQWDKKGVPWIFAPVAKFRENIKPDRMNEAQRVIYEVGVLRPFLEATWALMAVQEDGKWTYQEPEVKVLRQLMRVEAGKPLEDGDELFLDPFFKYIFGVDESLAGLYQKDKTDLHGPLGALYQQAWPPASVRSDAEVQEEAIQHGVGLFIEYWTDPNRLRADSEGYAAAKAIQELNEKILQFNRAEEAVLNLQGSETDGPHTVQKLGEFVRAWELYFARLKNANDVVDGDDQTLAADKTLEDLWLQAADTALGEVDKNYRFLLNELPEVEAPSFLADVRKRLDEAHRSASATLKNDGFAEGLKTLDTNSWARHGDRRLYQIRFGMYLKANEVLVADPPVSSLGEAEAIITQTKKRIMGARQAIDDLQTLGGDAYQVKKAAGVSRYALMLAEQRRLHHIVKGSLDAAPTNIEVLETLVAGKASWDWAGIPEDVANKRYDPNAASAVFADWKSLDKILEEADKAQYAAANEIYAGYRERYLKYWLVTAPKDWMRSAASMIPHEKTWKDQVAYLSDDTKMHLRMSVLGPLGRLGESVQEAVKKVGGDDSNGNYAQLLKDFHKDFLLLGDERGFQGTCADLLRNWGALSSSAFQARRKFLEKDDRLIANYFFFSDYGRSSDPALPGRAGHFVKWYWNELALTSLSLLNKDVQGEARTAIEQLTEEYGDKFPLVSEGGDLDPNELGNVRSLLGNLVPWKRTGDEKIAATSEVGKVLEQLRGLSLNSAQETQVTQIQSIFRGLPQGEGQKYFCRIRILKQDDQEERLLDLVTDFGIRQGGIEAKERTRCRENRASQVLSFYFVP